MSFVARDLEILTGMLIQGDILPIVYTLLKDSPYKEDILQYKSLLAEKHDIQKEKAPTEEKKESFDEWIHRVGVILEDQDVY